LEVTATIQYNGKDISADLFPLLESLTYTDNVEGESDELVITVADPDGRWRGAWYPDQGATLTATITADGVTLDCGSFEIDEIEFSGAPDRVQIRALAAGVTKAFRTKRSASYENETLEGIAKRIATAYGLGIKGTIRPVKIGRRTQHRTKDLRFLHELALEFGYVFTVTGRNIVFTDVETIEGAAPVLTINRADMLGYSFRDKVLETYSGAVVKYTNPETNETVTGDKSATATSPDTIEIRTRAEDSTQAAEKARAALHFANTKKVEASFGMPGNTRLYAGANVQIADFGAKISGKYHILRTTHAYSRGGYTTDIQAKKL